MPESPSRARRLHEAPLGVGRERRLPRAGQAEEDRRAAFPADVCRAVHRKNALEREAVVHHGEDGLDLARVERAADRNLATRQEEDERLVVVPVLAWLGLDRRCVKDERLRAMVGELALARVDEERACEERVPRGLGDDADSEPMPRIGPGERVDHVQVAAAEPVGEALAEALNASAIGTRTSPQAILSPEPGSLTT